MGLLNKLLGKKRIEEEIIKVLDDVDEMKKEKSETLEKDEQLLRGREEMVKYEKEQRAREVEREEEKKEEVEEKEKEEEVGEDELISSLKKETEEEEEVDPAIREEMEKMGNVSAGEILELGRTILQEMQGREGK